jgi:23S rRNA pseudouridine955/2504/2580 synthase/23S rRNA pseudouridine1911/1915/1917 synthase
MNISEIIIFENDDLIILNKPTGLLSIPDREGKEISLKKILQEKYGEIFTVHRIDKETSGLIVFAKNSIAHKFLSQQFQTDANLESKGTEKIYEGIVLGSPAEKKAGIDVPIAEHPSKKGVMIVHRKGKHALTSYEVIDDFGMFSHLKFQIHTGRTHQIRVHMKNLGHPIACDPVYGDGKPILLSSIKHRYKISKDQLEENPLLNRLALHARILKFKSAEEQFINAEAPLPKDLKAALNQLHKWWR